MITLFIFLISAICMDISFTGLLSKRLSPFVHLCIMANYVLCNIVTAKALGQWCTLAFVCTSTFIVYLGCKHSIINAIFSIIGYFICTLANHLVSIPLSIAGISLDMVQVQYPISFLLGWLTVTAILIYLVRKFFILPRLTVFEQCSPKLLIILLVQQLFCVTLFMINFAYGEYIHYPTEALTFNGILIGIFTLFTFVVFSILFSVFYQNKLLELQQQEQAHLLEYAQQMDDFYEEMRIFRHDYRNILSSLHSFIQDNDMVRLREYFEAEILPSDAIFTDNGFTIGKLHLIDTPALKSILYSKIMLAKSKGIQPKLELAEPIGALALDDITLCRVLGILLDNCIEAAQETEEKLLHIALIPTEECVGISLTNSTPPLKVPLSELSKKGFSTKEAHNGLGLASVHKLLEDIDTVTYTMGYNIYFRQTLEILLAKQYDKGNN